MLYQTSGQICCESYILLGRRLKLFRAKDRVVSACGGKKDGKMINKSLLLTYLYLLIYITLSSGVILYNKWVLSPKYFNFPFPITLTMIHMGFSGAVAFLLVRVFKVVSPVKMTFEIYSTCVIPISAFFASSLWFGNTAYLHISVAFIQMLKALMPVATFLMAVLCGTDKLSFMFLFVPWYFLEKPGMEVSQIQFNFWIFFSNAICALALNFSIFLVIGRTGAVTIRVAGVLKDWILIALSTVVFPESTITGLNIIGYAIALCGVVMYNYLKVKDVRASQLAPDSLPERIAKDWMLEKKLSDLLTPDSSDGVTSSASELKLDEEAPLIPSSRLSYIGRSQLGGQGS
ncbi:probable sugar phosphate/phosphate translocator At1g48230 isoform X2 [Rhododendron vialii]|uniref:probable sugar phosphate/phosphate translocator At1g48230 isoform X2 n=1 Tax=Rhododendron vialii TaxID=182163 RepID=UPI00265F5A1D|nr:probable sugar phosphate/phosphate translocator At1g48230 isoform X2 [Rhododendron vialii]